MFRAAFLRKVPLFIRNFGENVVLCLLAAGVESTANRFLEQLKLKWRSILTERVHKQYFNQMVRPAQHFARLAPHRNYVDDTEFLCNQVCRECHASGARTAVLSKA